MIDAVNLSFATLAVLLASACNHEQASVSEAARVSRAVDELRNAPNSAKRQRLSALQALHCQAEPVRRMQEVCVKAYTDHVMALEKLTRVKRELEHGSVGELSQTLEHAQKQLVGAEQQAQQCTSVQTEVQQRYGIDH